MWFNILKLDLSQLNTQIQSDADAKAINIQKPNKCKEKLLKIIEMMKDADKKGRQAFPNALEEVLKESEYKDKDGKTIKFYIRDWAGDDKIFAENSPYRFGFSVSSSMRNAGNFEEIDEMVACQLLEALKAVLSKGLDEPVDERKEVKNSEGEYIGRVEYTFLPGKNTFVRNRLAIYDTSNHFNVASISHGATGFPYSHETFEDHAEFEMELALKLYAQVYEPTFKKIRGML